MLLYLRSPSLSCLRLRLPSLYLTFLDILMKVWVKVYWPCRHGKSFAIWCPVTLGVCDGGREGRVPGVMLLHIHLRNEQVHFCMSWISHHKFLHIFELLRFNAKEKKNSSSSIMLILFLFIPWINLISSIFLWITVLLSLTTRATLKSFQMYNLSKTEKAASW